MYSFAIVLVCYNRLNSLKRLADSIKRAKYNKNVDVTLIFSIDNSGKTDILEYANSFEWVHGEKIIRTFETRQGLKNHILKCGEYTKQFDIVAVLEDDIVVSNSFFSFAYDAASFYFDDDNIAGISLYTFQKNWLKWEYRFEPMKNSFDVFFMRIAQSWGQVWTQKKWDNFMKWYENNVIFNQNSNLPSVLYGWPESSWLKYHTRYCIETNRFFVYPYVALSTNCGAAGEHSKDLCSDYQVDLQFDKSDFSFPLFDDNSIKYDEYMNRVGLEKYININGNLLVDMYSTRNNFEGFDYLLTTKKMKKKIVKKFSLSYHPIETSIIFGQYGDGIYLYDLRIDENNKEKCNSDLLEFFLRVHQSKKMFKFSFRLLKKEMKKFLGAMFKK